MTEMSSTIAAPHIPISPPLILAATDLDVESPCPVSMQAVDPTIRNRVDISETTFWLRRSDQLVLGILLMTLVTLLLIQRWRLSGGGLEEIEITSQQPREYLYSLDVNSASWVEWAQLDGIGEKLARRIVQNREQGGSFRSIEEVSRVRGIGPKLMDKIRPFLKCRDEQRQILKPSSRKPQ